MGTVVDSRRTAQARVLLLAHRLSIDPHVHRGLPRKLEHLERRSSYPRFLKYSANPGAATGGSVTRPSRIGFEAPPVERAARHFDCAPASMTSVLGRSRRTIAEMVKPQVTDAVPGHLE